MSKKAATKKRKPKPTIIEIASPDFFEHEDAGGVDKLAHDVEILIMEWAFFYPNHTPHAYLESKGYSPTQIAKCYRVRPSPEWYRKREFAQDKLTGTLVKRHVDLMAKVQDEHISASKLGLARAVEMLATGKTDVMRDKTGKVLLDKDGNPRFKAFRSIDLLNCMSSVEKAQNIYRKAMGLSNDDGGLDQILNKLDKMREHPTILNLTQTNVNVGEGSDAKGKASSDLSYDDIMTLIEMKREQKAKQVQAEIVDERLRLEHKEGTPTGDFTAAPIKGS